MTTISADHAHGHDDDGHGHDHHGHHPAQAHHFESMEQQFESGKLGMWVFLATEILMFGGLFCAYSIYRGLNPDVFLFAHKALDTKMGAINTAVLLASSFTMAWGVLAISRGKPKLCLLMLVLTFIGGCGFMGIKTKEYYDKYTHAFVPGKANAFYNVGGAYTNPEKLQEGVGYIQYKQGHGDDHHGDDHGAHGGDHSEDDAEHGDAEHENDGHAAEAAEGGHHGDDAHDAGKASPAGVEAAEDTAHAAAVPAAPPPSVWPPKPVDHANIKTPANAAPATHPNFTRQAEEVADVSAVESLYKGAAKAQAQAGHAHYPGSPAELDPLSGERTHIFFQIYFIMTGLHGLHVLIGMGVLLWVAWLVAPHAWRMFVLASAPATVGLYFLIAGYLMGPVVWMLVFGGLCLAAAVAMVVMGLGKLDDDRPGAFSPEYYTPVEIGGLYWHLVDLIWIFLFPLLYLIH